MFLELTVDGVTGRAPVANSDLEPVRRLLGALPLDACTLVPSCWSGPVCEIEVADRGIDFGTASVFRLGCSLYPGMLMLRLDRPLLEVSYGAGESRSATGVQYGLIIGRLEDSSGVLAKLATSHDVGELRGSLRAVDH